ncbi:MAG TPA: PepSY domain-containing protein [Bacillales bacterium]
MKKFLVVMAIAFGSTGVFLSPADAAGPITSNQARTIALDRINGEILNVGLEHEDDTRVYDVDMRTRYGSVEVIINASSGQIMELKKVIESSGE